MRNVISGILIGIIAAFGFAAFAQNFPAPPTPPPLTGCFPFTPTDQSGDNIGSFTAVSVQYCVYNNFVFYWGTITYPTTAGPSQATISMPIAAANQPYGQVASALLGVNGVALASNQGLNTASFFVQGTRAIEANSALSTRQLNFLLLYPLR